MPDKITGLPKLPIVDEWQGEEVKATIVDEMTDPEAIRLVATEFLRQAASTMKNGSILRPTVLILGSNISIGAGSVISDNVIIYDNTIIGEGAYIGANTVIGCPEVKTGLPENATVIMPGKRVGAGCIIENGCVVYRNVEHKTLIKRKAIAQRFIRLLGWFYRKRDEGLQYTS